MTTKENRPQLHFRFPHDLFEHLKQKSLETDRSMNGYIVHLLRADAAKKASEGKPGSNASDASE